MINRYLVGASKISSITLGYLNNHSSVKKAVSPQDVGPRSIQHCLIYQTHGYVAGLSCKCDWGRLRGTIMSHWGALCKNIDFNTHM